MSGNNEFQQNPTEISTTIQQTPNYDTIQTAHFHQKYAGFWTRTWSYLIDIIILSAFSGILIKPIFRVVDVEISNPSFLFFTPYKITYLLLFLIYFALMTKFFHQTVGKMIMGIKVESKDGEKLSWSTVIFREVVGRFISKILFIPNLLVIFMPKKEALHDLFADTVVIHENAYEKVIETKYKKRVEVEHLQDEPVV